MPIDKPTASALPEEAVRDDAEAFFRKILPGVGVYQLATIKDRSLKHHVFEDISEMAASIGALAAKNTTVYHACAAYHTRENRCARNVRAVKAFWLDLDVGDDKASNGKGYTNKVDALEALEEFCKTVGLPRPLIVDSGGGIHAYWVLDAEIDAKTWKSVANKLKNLARQRKGRSSRT